MIILLKQMLQVFIGTKNITNDGSLNLTTDTITLTAGGEGALFQVEDIGPGKITEIIIDSKGSSYEIGDNLVFVNTGTNGLNAAESFVKIVNGGIADQNAINSYCQQLKIDLF